MFDVNSNIAEKVEGIFELYRYQTRHNTEKYLGLPPGHVFLPVAVETLRAIDPRLLTFLKEIG